MTPALAYLLVFIGVLGHASSEFFAVLSGVKGAEVSVWRYLIGACGLLLIALAYKPTRDLWTPLKRSWRRLLPITVIGVSFAYLFFHWALDYATAIQVGTLVTTIPIFVGLSNLVVNRVPISNAKLASGAAAVAGVALLLTDGYLQKLSGDDQSIYGVILALLCAALGSAYAVLVKPIIVEYGAIRITTISLTIGAIVLWLIVGSFFGIWVNPFALFEKEPVAAWSLLTLGIWNTTITQLVWLGGLAAVPDITRGSYLFFLKPVITALLALVILAQPITLVQILAMVVISSCVLIELSWPWLTARLRGAN